MSLILEIEYLTGTCRATRDQADTEPEWPPQPDRVFSALVAAWGDRGEDPSERAALEWLEQEPAPEIHAGGYAPRTAPEVFVPPNDMRASSTGKTYLRVMPEHRRRQERRFPVAWLEDPVLTMAWADRPASGTLEALDQLARHVAYVGHSSSFVRCRFRLGEPASLHQARTALRRVYPGRLQELAMAYHACPRVRPGPGASALTGDARAAPEAKSDWLVLEHIGGDVPDMRASALVCRELRRALMSGYQRIGLGNAIPEMVSGHAPDGKPTKRPHLAIAPMAFVGFEHADGRVLGFSVIAPVDTKLLDLAGFRKAFNEIAPYDSGKERRILTLKAPPLPEPIQLSPAGAGPVASLRTDRYLNAAQVWASATPIVLDRHPKGKGENEVQEMLADACANAGLPRPAPERILVAKHSALTGAPPATRSAGEPRWMRWKKPEAFMSRLLTHAVIDFGEPVAGPVLLGAGRFTGLGLCCGLSANGT